MIVVSCKSTSSNSQAQPDDSAQQLVFQESDRELTDSAIKIRLKNSDESTQIILNPMKKKIEKNDGGEWKAVSVLYCDCGGPPCPAPPRELTIEAGGSFTFTWDLMIEECKSDQNGRRTTLKEKASKGDYRAVYRFKSASGGEIQNLVINFSIN